MGFENNKYTAEEILELCRRVEYEDQLLNSRTTIVLTLNGLMAVAASCSLPNTSKIIIALIISVVNMLWIVCSLDAQRYIHGLITRINLSEHNPIAERIRGELHQYWFRIGSTRFMSLVIPVLLLVGWVVGSVVPIF